MTMEQEDYCSYELALKLKECGFNELTNSFYDEASVQQGVFEIVPTYAKFNEVCRTPGCECVSAPTLAHTQKWLREKGIAVSVQANEIQGELWYSADIITTKGINELVDGGFDYMGYEAALSAGLSAALELIEQEKE